jgi:hypothetical protein
MIYYLGSILVFFTLFLFYPATKIQFSDQILETWIWNKSQGFGTRPFPGLENPHEVINGYKTANGFYSLREKKMISGSPDRKIEYSIFGDGFWEYKKLGDEILFWSSQRELFWKKAYSSYPRPGYFSGIIPLVSGDGNTVFLIDKNGNPLDRQEVNGRFLVDIAYATEEEVIGLLFSGGEYMILDGEGKILASDTREGLEETETYFAKSIVVSPKGNKYAIHYQSGNKDWVRLYHLDLQKERKIELPEIYPHRISLAVSDSGNLLLSLKEGLVGFDPDLDELFRFEFQNMNPVYSAILFRNGYFFAQVNYSFFVIREDGAKLGEWRLANTQIPFRFLPGSDKKTLYWESKEEIRQIQFF